MKIDFEKWRVERIYENPDGSFAHAVCVNKVTEELLMLTLLDVLASARAVLCISADLIVLKQIPITEITSLYLVEDTTTTDKLFVRAGI
jgi:hypothetical protein